ncbi:Ribosomal RNA small subunit methyltransferase B [Diplonema papillatum]|nr:Ribosomal RNA small subunit methyltransferase B [Diplonema papillatum]
MKRKAPDAEDDAVCQASAAGVEMALAAGFAAHDACRKVLRKWGKRLHGDGERGRVAQRVLQVPMLQATLLYELTQPDFERPAETYPPQYTAEKALALLNRYVQSREQPPPEPGGAAGIHPGGPPPKHSAAGPVEYPDLATEFSIPRWLEQFLLDRLGSREEAARYCELLNAPADTCLRVNPHKAVAVEDVRASLEADGIVAAADPLLPETGLVISRVKSGGKANVKGSAMWQAGVVEVQDRGSQLLAAAARPPGAAGSAAKRGRILDYCCGLGGKALQLASTWCASHDVVAADISAEATRELGNRLKRCGLQEFVATELHPLGPSHSHAYDSVLVDAPCGALGRLRRRTDNRWRMAPDSLRSFVPTQKSILSSAATHVAPGGVLVYATCTINPLENEAVVRSFEATEGYRSLGFAPDALEAAWGPATARLLGLGAGQHDMTLFPHRHGTDGFFVCRWRRAPAAPASPTARSPPANPC